MNQQPLQTPPPPQAEVPPQQPPPPPAGQNPAGGAPNTPFEPPSAPGSPGAGFEPPNMQPAPSGGKTWILWIILLIFLILGGLFFASWEGWISLGGLEKYWKKTTPTTMTTAPTVSTATANDNTRKADLANIKDALKKYYQANQSYPIASSLQKTSESSNALTVLVPTYIAKLPLDPLSPSYYYGYTSSGKTFELTARLEDTTDPAAIKTSDTIYLYKVTDSSVETPTSTTQ